MKKLILILLISCISLCGCWNYTEIEDDSLVSGIAVDPGENGYAYKLSLEIINTPSSEKAENQEPKILTENGNTILECLSQVLNDTSRVLFLSHCKIFLINEEVAKDGIQPLLDVFLRKHDLRLDIDIAIVRGIQAGELLKLKSVIDPIRAYEISRTIQDSSKYLGRAPRIPFWKLVNILSEEGQQLVLPVFEKTEESTDESFALKECAIFQGDRLCGFMSSADGQLYMLLTKQLKETVLNIPVGEGDQKIVLSPEILDYTVEIHPEETENGICFEIQIQSDFVFEEIPPEIELNNQKNIKKMEEQLTEVCSQMMFRSIKFIQSEYQTDIYGFGNLLYRKENRLWKEVGSDWAKIFPTITFTVDWTVKIITNGYANGNIQVK